MSRGRLLALAAALATLVLAALFADEALAQSTGGSFGGGSFGGGGGSSGGGGGSYSGGDDGGDSVVTFIVWILVSRLPWPLKIGLIAVIGGGWVAFKLIKKRQEPPSDDGHP